MKLSKHLVLFRYLLHQFGFENFEKLRDEFSNKLSGYDATGRSYFANALMAIKKQVDDATLLQYDDVIKGYEEELVKHRSEPYLSFKYYQYFTLLFTEYFLDELSNRHENLLIALNDFKQTNKDFNDLPDYEKGDLKKLALWMATGSGKTLLMHVNFRQMLKYIKNWENILLITPNEGLSQQHYEEFRKSGIKARLYSGSEESLKTQEGEVLIIEITKLTKDKEGEGVSVDVDYFSESRNLVFIDEGHKGQRSEEKAWKKLREHLTRGEQSFTFEYSATFGQIIGNSSSDLLDEYSRAILFDYSYRHFYADGYGKDFSVFNIDANEDYSDKETKLLLTASLLGFYEQVVLFEKHEAELKQYNIEKPLWVFVGSKVIGKKSSLTQQDKQNVSDVTLVLNFFRSILESPTALQVDADTILSGKSGLQKEGDDIFKNRFLYLKNNRPTAEEILQKVFHGAGIIEALQIKNADGEIGLQTSTGQQYFGVINIGDVGSFGKKLEEDTKGAVQILDDNFTQSLFHSLSDKHSNINILIGSKKFIEGWNSWRVSSMGLMNMGQGEGAQIIQLFGRGVRLKGKEFSLKREEGAAAYFIKALQTISIFGLNAKYMNSFLGNIEKEVDNMIEYSIAIQFNNKEDWENKIYTFRTDEKHDFKKFGIELAVKESVLKRIEIDLRPRIAVAAGGFNSELAEAEEEYISGKNPLHEFTSFLDFESLLINCSRYKYVRNYTNLIISQDVLKEVIQSDFYKLITLKNQLNIKEAVSGKLQSVAESLLKDYINKFYSDKEKDFLTKNLAFDFLSEEKYPAVFPDKKKMIVKVPETKKAEYDKLFEDIAKFYTDFEIKEIATIHFDRHLYSPLASYRKGKEDIKTVPVKMNKGETDFIKHLSSYLISQADKIKDKEIFVLRNLSKRGVGFFIESSSFYPDFIIWVVTKTKQTILFVDPKGILMLGNFKNDKIVFCNETIKEINDAIGVKAKKEKLKQEIELKAYILSVTPYNELKNSWESSVTKKEDFTNNNVLFIDDDREYLVRMFDEILNSV